MRSSTRKKVAVVGIELMIAALFVVGASVADRSLRELYHSYFADVALPFGLYFLLAINAEEVPILGHWWAKAIAVFALCAASETLQYFGIFALARVFDPVDYVMYGAGVLLAALVDTQVFARVFKLWNVQDQ